MTEQERERLAALIAQALTDAANATTNGKSESWLPIPVRPEPPTRGGEPAVWSGAAQSLGDIAPIREPSAPRHRSTTGELTAAVRAAAAGRAQTPPRRAAPQAPQTTHLPPSFRRRASFPIAVRLGVSNRHIHLSPEHVRVLFGPSGLESERPLLQPGQFAARESVTVVGPSGEIKGVRVVGPARGDTQVEVSRSDARRLGVEPPLAASGHLGASVGGVTLVGPHGRVALDKGVIIAARHLHLAPTDASRWGLQDGDRLDVRCGEGARAVTLHDVLVRAGVSHATELHLDVDEAHAAAVKTGDTCHIIARREGAAAQRRLFTERDIVALVRSKGSLPPNALLTPSARDRATALGLLKSK